MTRDDIYDQVATLARANHPYADIASRLNITSSYVGRVLVELRKNGILPPAEPRYERKRKNFSPPIDSDKHREIIHAVEIAISRYAAITEDSRANVLRFLGTRNTVELAAELLGLSGGDGETVTVAMRQAVSCVLERHGYVIAQLSGYRAAL
ncbi:MAG: hypothetical protein ACYCYO_17885 [Bacilli bacterium]